MFKKILGAPLVQISILAALVLGGMYWPLGLFEHLENKNFDFWSTHFREPDDSSVAIVAIDEASMASLGNWPWPRSRIAEMIDLLSGANAQAQGLCLLYTQPDVNPGLEALRQVSSQIADPNWKGQKKSTEAVLGLIDEAQTQLDHDALLISAVRRGKNSVLPIRFSTGAKNPNGPGKPSGLMIINSLKRPGQIARNTPSFFADRMQALGAERGAVTPPQSVHETFGALAGKAGALGHINLTLDTDGIVRRLPLLIDYKDRLYPSLAFQLALKQINAGLRGITFESDFFSRPILKRRHLALSTDNAYQMLVNHDPLWTQARTYAFARVLDGTIDPSEFRNKVVLIGITDPAAAPVYRVGGHNGVSLVEITANTFARILSNVQLSRPSWAFSLEIVAVLYFAFFLVFFIPRVSMRLGGAILIIFLMTWYAIGVGLFLGYGYWIKFAGPALLGCLGFLTVQSTMFSRLRQLEKLESNKTLGLSYQGQGMLDMAYEKYMQCPVKDETVKHLLYNLGLDFERKRMFNKAEAIYQHIRTDGTFKDIKERISRLKSIDDALSRTGSTRVGEATIKADDDSAKPTFGRYEIIKELGHGAMGTVYLGRDPKINREVAIKTVAYSEVEPGELEEVKERFFREAEAAGKLSHPNIVSIFDAGEEHDMAYIAMESLTGGDLTHHCAKDNLLPFDKVVSIISEVTTALDYAHQKGVVHRDIKPGNIMLLDDDRVKVTDFGIARVVDASRTGTGVVLGTPSYMSPEQVTGKKVDGRSDLFSLGIVFYQLLTGVKPFRGDNITAIMYAITHHPHTPLVENTDHLPDNIVKIVNKLLSKGVTKRYQTAAQLARALEAAVQPS